MRGPLARQAGPGEVRDATPLDVLPPAAVSCHDVFPCRLGSGCSGVFALPGCSLQCAENTKFLVRASYLEIYNEDVRDLLGTDAKQKLEVGWVRPWPG